MTTASVRPQSAAAYLIRSADDISHPRQQGKPCAAWGSSAASGPVCSDIINHWMTLVQVQSGGMAIPRCLMAGLLAPFPVLLTLLLSLCHQVMVSTCQRKVMHRIAAPLRVPQLVVPHLALMLTTRRLMQARMSSLQTGMPRALWWPTMTIMKVSTQWFRWHSRTM